MADELHLIKTDISKEIIDKLFEDAKDTDEATIELYKLAIPVFDELDKVENFPEISSDTNKYIFRKMIDLDVENKVTHMNGGRWLNSGFSTNNDLPDWMCSWKKQG